jgi:hypothetical protein
MDKIFETIVLGLLVLVIVAFFALLLAFPTMLLWNWLMPVIFGLTKITFWQAVGINFLSGILFKSSSSSTKSSS